MIGTIIKKVIGFAIPWWLSYAVVAGGAAFAASSATYRYLDWMYDFDQSEEIKKAIERHDEIIRERNRRLARDEQEIEKLKETLTELRLRGGPADDRTAIPVDDPWLRKKSR